MEANAASRQHKTFLAEFRQSSTLLGVGPAARARLEDTGCRKRDINRDIPSIAKFHAIQAAARGETTRPDPLPSDGRRKPSCPKELSGHARTAWRMLVNDLWDSRIIEDGDRAALATAAMHYGSAMTSLELIERHGLVYPVTRGARDGNPGYKVIEANPAAQMLRDSLAEFRQCCDLLGIGPSSRARLRHLGMKGRSTVGIIPGIGGKPQLISRDPVTGERKVLEG